jgi:hypothetical protein
MQFPPFSSRLSWCYAIRLNTKPMRALFSALLATICLFGNAQPSLPQSVSARQRYETLTKALQEANAAKDWPAYLAAAKEFQQFLNSSPSSLATLARAYALNNDIASALHALEQFAAMGQASDVIEKSPDFVAVRKLSEFAALKAAMEANQAPVTRASMAFPLDPLAGLIAEDVAYDTDPKKTFYFTTVLGKKIFSATFDGHILEFATSPSDLPLLALKVDSRRGLLWVTAVGLRDFRGVAATAQGTSELLCYEIGSHKLLQRIQGPANSALGDFAIARNGDLILSDNKGGGIYLLPEGSSSLQRIDNGEFVSPQTPAISPNGKLIFVPDYARGIGVLNRATKQVRWLDSQNKFALAGIDGLYFANGKLLAVQNGSSPERVVLFSLSKTLASITSETVIEHATETLGDPTHGVVVANAFYYIASSGWDALDDQGSLKTDAKPTPPRLMRFQLQ